MKIRTFRKCINRKKDYKYLPKYTHKIFGIGLGEDTRYICGKVRARMQNGKFIVHIVKPNYTFLGHPVYLKLSGVYHAMTDKWLGHLYEDPFGTKYVYGPDNKGPLRKCNPLNNKKYEKE